jgi:hypothetical protein
MMPCLLTIRCVFTVCFFFLPEYYIPFFFFRQWHSLFCAIGERQKAWEMPFNFFWCGHPFSCFVLLLRNWHALSNQLFNFLDIPPNVALVQVKQKASESVGYVKAVICKQRHKAVLNIQIVNLPAPMDRSLSFLLDNRLVSCLPCLFAIPL